MVGLRLPEGNREALARVAIVQQVETLESLLLLRGRHHRLAMDADDLFGGAAAGV